MFNAENEQRRHHRSELVRPCRIFDPRSGKYLHGTTCNLSLGGALIRIARPCMLQPGDTLRVGIAMEDRQGFMQARDMFEATVVRALGTPSGQTMVAIQNDTATTPLQATLPKAA